MIKLVMGLANFDLTGLNRKRLKEDELKNKNKNEITLPRTRQKGEETSIYSL